MKTLLLVIALVAKADAPKAGLQEATAAPAAVAPARVFPEAASVSPSESPDRPLNSAVPVLNVEVEETSVTANAANEVVDVEARETVFGAAIPTADAEVSEATVTANAANAAVDAKACVPTLGEASESKAGELTAPVALADANTALEAVPRKTGVFPEPKSDASCSLTEMYTRKRFLSGPWSAARRLRAAQMRGDTAEMQRMEALFDDLVIKAVAAETEGP